MTYENTNPISRGKLESECCLGHGITLITPGGLRQYRTWLPKQSASYSSVLSCSNPQNKEFEQERTERTEKSRTSKELGTTNSENYANKYKVSSTGDGVDLQSPFG